MLRFLLLWSCTQRGQQKSTMTGRVMEVVQSIIIPVLQVENWRKKRSGLDCDYQEHDFLTVLSHLILLPSWSELFLSLVMGSHAKEKPDKQNQELVIPFWKACCPGWVWLCSSRSTDCQVITTNNSSLLKYEPWDSIRRWSSIRQALKQHVFVWCFSFGGKWKFGMVA